MVDWYMHTHANNIDKTQSVEMGAQDWNFTFAQSEYYGVTTVHNCRSYISKITGWSWEMRELTWNTNLIL